jgi:phosphoadenosine phosphosulfate reductase
LESTISRLITSLQHLTTSQALLVLADTYPGRVIFSTSFSMEDQVIAHEILSENIPVRIFSLDTGRLFPETYSVWSSTNEKYNTHIAAYYPDHQSLQSFVEAKGPNSFYESVENRKSCCYIRKVEPLQRALKGFAVWVTGLRAEHSPDRHDLPLVEWDEVNQIIKFHPLLHHTTEEIKQIIRTNQIPYNPLHDKGFISIGCAPCTRAVQPGEDFRAGRWWWEDQSKKECGLHVHAAPLSKVEVE